MGSVVDYIQCPDCGEEAHSEFWYKTGEETIMCLHCGYSRKFLITNLEDRTNDDWTPKFELEENHGCGSYKVRQKGQLHYECGAFVNEEGPKEFIRLVRERENDIEHAEYTTFVNKTLSRVVLVEGDSNE